MTDENTDKGNVDVTLPKSGIHISLPGALLISVIMGAATLLGHCSTNSASAISPDVAAKLDKLSSDVNDIKTNTKDLSTKVDNMKDDIQLIKIQLLQDQK